MSSLSTTPQVGSSCNFAFGEEGRCVIYSPVFEMRARINTVLGSFDDTQVEE